MADKADWGEILVRHLIDVCKGEIQAGNRPNGIFTSTGWKNLVSKFEEKAGVKRTKKQLKNKLDNMKKQYTWFRKHGRKYLDDLHILFDKVHVTGASASCPGDISSGESSDDNVVEAQPEDVKLAALKKSKPGKKKRKGSCTEENDERSPFLRLYKNTCMRIETAAEKISSSVEASSAPLTNPVPTIAEAMKMVKDCGVQERTALMHTATFLIMKPEFREVLSSLETNEGRLDLLEREHDKDMMKRM